MTTSDKKLTRLERDIEAANKFKFVKIRLKASRDSFVFYFDSYVNGKRKTHFTKLRVENKHKTYYEDRKTLLNALSLRDQLEKEAVDQSQTPDEAVELKINFLEFFRQYVNEAELPKKSANSDSTANRKNYIKSYNHWKAFAELYHFESLTIGELKKTHLQQFAKFLIKGLSVNSAHLYFSKIKAVLNFLTVKKDILTKNPALGVVITKEQTTPVFLTPEELTTLAGTEIKNEDIKQAFLFQVNTGLRFSDIQALTFDNCDRDFVTIRMKKTATPVTIPLNTTAKNIVRQQRAKYESGNVFKISPYCGKYNEALKRWAKSAGLTKNISSHVGRHTAATMLINAGASIYTIQQILGHSDIKNTQRYSHLADIKKSEAVELISY